MSLKSNLNLQISPELLDAIREFPVNREIQHCGRQISVAAFEFYAECPECGTQIKLRSFSAVPEIEDVFDAVFEWMNTPKGQQAAARRQQALADDDDD